MTISTAARSWLVAVCATVFAVFSASATTPMSWIAYFGPGSTKIDAQAEAILEVVVRVSTIKECSGQILVEGHVDLPEASFALSQARAAEIKSRLVELGIRSDRIIVKGSGDTKPLRRNASGAPEPQNRRAEIACLRPDLR